MAIAPEELQRKARKTKAADVSTSSIAAPAPAGIPGDITGEIRRLYGYGSWALDIPDLASVLRDAVARKLGLEQVIGAISKTYWYQTHNKAQRDWIAQQGEDRKTADQTLASHLQHVRTMAGQLGVNVSEPRINQIASDSLSIGWSEEELRAALAREWHYDPTQPSAMSMSLRQVSQGDYFIPLSDSALSDWGQKIVSGTKTVEDFRAYASQQAMSLYPEFSTQLQAGDTMKTLADPYAQIAGKELEINPDTIDFTDAKWSRALSNVDPKTNQRHSLSLADWTRTIRNEPVYGWDGTTGARTTAANLRSQLNQMFGVGQ